MHGSMPPVSPGLPIGLLARSHVASVPDVSNTHRRASLDAWPTSATMPSLASTLEMMLSRANITTVDEFADMLLSAPTFIANLIRSEAAATAAEAAATAVGTMTDATTTRSVGTEAALAADDVVDTAIAEAIGGGGSVHG